MDNKRAIDLCTCGKPREDLAHNPPDGKFASRELYHDFFPNPQPTPEGIPTIPHAKFPSIPRLSKNHIIISEKIDGTNALIYIDDQSRVYAGSRNRWITPEDDNYGFAKWVASNVGDLSLLGPGMHYGEWYGSGIQRGYGLNHKRFALFNTSRPRETLPPCIEQVPVLKIHAFDSAVIEDVLADLRMNGSRAVPGFMRPEGIVIYHVASKTLFKKTLEGDGGKFTMDEKTPKEVAA